MENILAKIETKSNYKKLNGKFLEVKELQGTRVSCLVFSEELGKYVTTDFQLKEVKEFKILSTFSGLNQKIIV